MSAYSTPAYVATRCAPEPFSPMVFGVGYAFVYGWDGLLLILPDVSFSSPRPTICHVLKVLLGAVLFVR